MKLRDVPVVVAGLALSAPVLAQETPASGLDVSGAVGFLSGDVTTALTAVGGAVILLAALAMGFKWVKAMFFG
jgi:hypothetical protein